MRPDTICRCHQAIRLSGERIGGRMKSVSLRVTEETPCAEAETAIKEAGW